MFPLRFLSNLEGDGVVIQIQNHSIDVVKTGNSYLLSIKLSLQEHVVHMVVQFTT